MSLQYINFYDPKKPYGWGSNFYKAKPLIIDGEKWATSEAYFQAMKFRGPKATPRSIKYSNLIKIADSPAKVAMLGRQRQNKFYGAKWKLDLKKDPRLVNSLIEEYRDVKMRDDWESARFYAMVKAVVVKFTEQEDLRRAMLELPDNVVLVEHTTRDNVWGDGGNGTGTNYLGKILTAVSWIIKHGDCSSMPSSLRRAIYIGSSAKERQKIALNSPAIKPTVNKPIVNKAGGASVQLTPKLHYGIHPSVVKPAFHVDHYVDLTEETEMPYFEIGKNGTLHRFPIKDRKAVKRDELSKIVRYIRNLPGVVYISCKGGHGRSGMVAAAVYGKEKGLCGKDALAHINREWKTQRDLTLLRPAIRKLGSPQTLAQKKVVKEYLDSRPAIRKGSPQTLTQKLSKNI